MKAKIHIQLSVLALAISAGIAQAQESTTLDTVTVTGNAVPTIVTEKQLDQRIATDLKQALKDQIGLEASAGNGVAQYYSIRSIGEDKITLDVDGATASSSVLHHQGRFMLDPTLVKVIDVEKGTGSASAGIGALAGVVRVTTVDAKDLLKPQQPIGLKIGSTFSSNKGFSTNLATYANQNGFDLLLAGNFLQNDNYKDGQGEKAYGSKLDQNSYLIKAGYDLNEDHQIRFSLRQEYQQGRRIPQIEFAYDPTKENIGEADSAQRQRTLNAEYNGKNFGFISHIHANVFRTQIDDYKPPKAVKKGKNPSIAMELTQMFSTGANLNLESEVGKHTLKYGVNYRSEKNIPSSKPWLNKAIVRNEKKDEYGIYAEGVWDLDPITLTTGLRYDHFDYYANNGSKASHGQLNPSLSAIWGVTPNLALIATLNQASRAPRLQEALLANEGFAGAGVNHNLKAETARRGEIGFHWQQDGFDVSASVFQQNIKDLVVFKKDKKDSAKGYIYNDGELKMHGYEADASYKINGFKARVAVSESKPKISGIAFAHPQEENPYYFWNTGRQWLTSLSYRFDNPHLELGWIGRYAEKVNYYSAKQKATGNKAGYGVHDIFVNWQPTGKDDFNINLGINNIGNKLYRSQSQRGGIGYYERGREFIAGINYRF